MATEDSQSQEPVVDPEAKQVERPAEDSAQGPAPEEEPATIEQGGGSPTESPGTKAADLALTGEENEQGQRSREPDSPAVARSDDGQGESGEEFDQSGNLALMMDLPLEVVVELGQASLPLASVLALGPGSVIELGRHPGEPLDLYVNGNLMARGEVVVLNETFGFRVTEIVSKSAWSSENG